VLAPAAWLRCALDRRLASASVSSKAIIAILSKTRPIARMLFVTGLTIGYGDIVPRQTLARVLSIGIGVSGLFLTGLIAGIAVYAMRTALTDQDTG
jgi:hypothetical protein